MRHPTPDQLMSANDGGHHHPRGPHEPNGDTPGVHVEWVHCVHDPYLCQDCMVSLFYSVCHMPPVQPDSSIQLATLQVFCVLHTKDCPSQDVLYTVFLTLSSTHSSLCIHHNKIVSGTTITKMPVKMTTVTPDYYFTQLTCCWPDSCLPSVQGTMPSKLLICSSSHHSPPLDPGH